MLKTNRFKEKLLSFVSFQVGWWSCVLQSEQPYIYAPVVFSVFIFHLLFLYETNLIKEIIFTILSSGIGYSLDSFFSSVGLLNFLNHSNWFAPYWLLSIWLLFSASIGLNFSWAKGRWRTVFLIGAVFGPLSYKLGEKFELLYFAGILQLLIYSFYWGIILNLLVLVHSKYIGKSEV